MLAFHNDPAIKDKYVARVHAHRMADDIIRGSYGCAGGVSGWRGCAVGCTIHSGAHSAYERELGIPQSIAMLEDCIFEGMSIERTPDWPLQFLTVISPGADLSMITSQFLLWLLAGVIRFADDSTRPSIQGVIALYQRLVAGDTPTVPEWESARSAADAARSAARRAYAAYAARSAEIAADAAATYAARSADWSAARSAADAARSAYAAADAADSANAAVDAAADAYAARSAYAAAAWSAYAAADAAACADWSAPGSATGSAAMSADWSAARSAAYAAYAANADYAAMSAAAAGSAADAAAKSPADAAAKSPAYAAADAARSAAFDNMADKLLGLLADAPSCCTTTREGGEKE